MESSIIDVISKLSPMEVKILKSIAKRFGDSYFSDNEVIDELVDNWGVDFYVAAKLAKIYKSFKFYITHEPSEKYKEVNKSEVFTEYFARFIINYDKNNEIDYGRELLDRLTFNFKKVDGMECVGNLVTDFWTYNRSILGYNKYFSFYSRPKLEYSDECFISSTNSITTTCSLNSLDDTHVNIEYMIKYHPFGGDESIHNFTDTLPIPEKLDYDITVDWFKDKLYSESYQKALKSVTFHMG